MSAIKSGNQHPGNQQRELQYLGRYGGPGQRALLSASRARIVEIYPEWRGYEVILVKGRYVIVRPQTHEIVYIIEG